MRYGCTKTLADRRPRISFTKAEVKVWKIKCSCLGENRLTGLALRMVHRDMDVSWENILKRFGIVI